MIDYATATPRSIIETSMRMHPSVFAQRLTDAARTHNAYAAVTHNETVKAIAYRCYEACATASNMVYGGDIDGLMGDMNRWIPALNIACDLMLVPRHERGAIAGR